MLALGRDGAGTQTVGFLADEGGQCWAQTLAATRSCYQCYSGDSRHGRCGGVLSDADIVSVGRTGADSGGGVTSLNQSALTLLNGIPTGPMVYLT